MRSVSAARLDRGDGAAVAGDDGHRDAPHAFDDQVEHHRVAVAARARDVLAQHRPGDARLLACA
ncbi:MAG: hypothetical protein R3E68_18025 [Burkholderiaceae bacterium]